MRSGFKAFILPLLLGAVFLQSGCAMDVDTNTTLNKPVLEKSAYSAAIPAADLNTDTLVAMSSHYRDYGDGPVDVVVTYDPASRVNTAMKASSDAARIAKEFKAWDIPVSGVDILPVSGQGEVSEVKIFYDQIMAHPPKDCYNMGGMEGIQTQADWNYKHGCTVESLMARQIASPKDLAGREGLDAGSGRRQSNILEVYQTGAGNAALEGETTGD
jgi:type IV pilus biogenesis protein CpaD/CtpE